MRDMRPGLNFLLPFNIETATHVDMRTWTDVLPAQSLRTKDGVEVVIRLMVSYEVEDPRTFVLKIFDATNNVQDIAAGALGAAVSNATAEQLDSGLVLRRVRAAVSRAAKAWGVGIKRVQLSDHTRATSFRLFGATKDEG